ncbi:MAG: hypothetical protein A3F80_06120 [Candidatus Melainabacteria bacterium RIFCSPLOWO2_12_FULL_35_11]|nr:MAG: hypothetical protein A3F80_06120 [Candidatus Melainabacteria bacterium RIFCSPLOWO2_12_FULL_35_11]
MDKIFAKEIISLKESHDDILKDDATVSEMRRKIKEGSIYVFKNAYPKDKINKIKQYLCTVGQNSIPNYMKIEKDCPNSHRINIWDERAYVLACMHQFAFFPWNQDIFCLFDCFKQMYHLRNLLSGNPKNKFLGLEPEDDCIGRITFQFYPSGIGGMNKHQDPIGHHQLAIPIMQMSTKGEDFHKGGNFMEGKNGEKIMTDDLTSCGDIVYFNASIPHGVDTIDPGHKVDWFSFKGRWMVIFAVNKLFGTVEVDDALDLVKKEKVAALV